MDDRPGRSARPSERIERLSGLDHPVASFQLSVAMSQRAQTDAHRESRSEAFGHLLEECRMVLPGIQALFGFQLIAVFNQVFWSRVPPVEQVLHLVAIGLVALSIALVMTPAAYHRQAEPGSASSTIIALSSRLLFWSMVPLLAALCCEFYIIGQLVLDSRRASLALTIPLTALFCLLWFALPRARRLQRLAGAGRRTGEPATGWKVTRGA